MIRSEKDAEEFLLKHGENIVDCLGQENGQIDRIASCKKNSLHTKFKKKYRENWYFYKK